MGTDLARASFAGSAFLCLVFAMALISVHQQENTSSRIFRELKAP